MTSNSSNDKYNYHSKLPMICDDFENNAEIKGNTSTSRESQKQKKSISLADYELTLSDDGEESVSDSAKKLVRLKNLIEKIGNRTSAENCAQNVIDKIKKLGSNLRKTQNKNNCSKCKFKRTKMFSKDDRILIWKTYCGLNNYNRQKDYIIQNVKIEEPKR